MNLPAAAVEFDPVTGLSTKPVSILGGFRSRHVDAAIDAITVQNPTIGAHLPPIMLAKVWSPADVCTSIMLHDPDRFARPTPEQQSALGLSDDQVNQIIWNLQLQNNFSVSSFMGNPNNTPPSAGYRGEAGRSGFPKYVPETIQIYNPYGDGLIPHEVSFEEHALKMHFWSPSLTELRPTGPLGHMEAVRTTFFPDHTLLDPWWDARTGVNLARYYLSFAIAHGVNVSPDPVN